MIQLRRAAAPLVAFAATSLLVACSNETAAAPVVSSAPVVTSEPVVTPTASEPVATPASVATKNLPAPEQDELSKTFTVDGAGAFAGYFTRVLNYSRATGDPTLLRSISDPDCGGCNFYSAEIDEYRARGYISEGFILQFTGARVESWDPAEGKISLTVTMTRPAYDTTDRDGSVLGSAPAESSAEARIDLSWLEGHWTVWEVE